MQVDSWGRIHSSFHSSVQNIYWADQPVFDQNKRYLAYGKGRSYGDCCLNENEILLATEGLNRLISFDSSRGLIECEAGLSLSDLIDFILPHGWFVPVTPGTKYVSVGGAIANDVHGKNHHVSGTFGRFVRELEILRSNGERVTCSPDKGEELFNATIAGLGLTGLLLKAKVQLKKVNSSDIICENIPFSSIREFLEISPSYSSRYEYSVAWLDCASKGKNFGRGILMCGRHDNSKDIKVSASKKSIKVPFDMPGWFLNKFLIRRFNEFYFYLKSRKDGEFVSHYDPFFYPLDAAVAWNRLYGRKGFFQFQCVIPSDNNNEGLVKILEKVKQSHFSSYLVVLKEFGRISSPGLMSFPRPGMTLCLDFPNSGPDMVRFISDLNAMAIDFGGAIYPAKDAIMSKEQFQMSFPNFKKFQNYLDPKFSSSFWRRVSG